MPRTCRSATLSSEEAATVKSTKKVAKAAPKKARMVRESEPKGSLADGRRSLADFYMRQYAKLADVVEAAIRGALPKLAKKARGEDLYAFALYTSGERVFTYVEFSANTEQGLSRRAAAYASRKRGTTVDGMRASLRWNPCDWELHGFAKMKTLKASSPALRIRQEDDAIWEAFATALERCDAAGLFGRGEARDRITLSILCGDMGSRFFMKGVRRLNPKRVAARTQREWRLAVKG